jgi:polysaccharide biosynthesis protein VpsQ
MPPNPLLALGSPTFEALMLALAGGALAAGVAVGVRQRARAAPSDPWRWRWLLWPQLGVLLAVSLMAYAGAISGSRMPWLRLPGMDKALHFLLFGPLAFSMHFVCRGRTLGRAVRVPLAVLVPLLAAVGEELAQAATPNRTADPLDLLADLLGLLVFWQLGRRVHDKGREHVEVDPVAEAAVVIE